MRLSQSSDTLIGVMFEVGAKLVGMCVEVPRGNDASASNTQKSSSQRAHQVSANHGSLPLSCGNDALPSGDKSTSSDCARSIRRLQNKISSSATTMSERSNKNSRNEYSVVYRARSCNRAPTAENEERERDCSKLSCESICHFEYQSTTAPAKRTFCLVSTRVCLSSASVSRFRCCPSHRTLARAGAKTTTVVGDCSFICSQSSREKNVSCVTGL